MTNPSLIKKSAARMMAVQCLYQRQYLPADLSAVQLIARVSAMQEEEDEDRSSLDVQPDEKLLRGIVTGFLQQEAAVEQQLTEILAARWEGERLTALMKALLRAATYELIYHQQLKTAVVLNEYVSLAADFYEAQETGLLNGLLQELGNALR